MYCAVICGCRIGNGLLLIWTSRDLCLWDRTFLFRNWRAFSPICSLIDCIQSSRSCCWHHSLVFASFYQYKLYVDWYVASLGFVFKTWLGWRRPVCMLNGSSRTVTVDDVTSEPLRFFAASASANNKAVPQTDRLLILWSLLSAKSKSQRWHCARIHEEQEKHDPLVWSISLFTERDLALWL